MPNYDFATLLSSIDFELLSKDLLESRLKLEFQTFSEGADGGIDLLCEKDDQKIVVQCRRYKIGSYAALKSSLLNEELPKVKKIKPSRYIITTSVKLTLKKKKEILKIFNPYIKTTNDIYGYEDLNSLLTKFPEIEKAHIKLWATSAAMMESILRSPQHKIAKEELDRTFRAAKLYVKNESFEEAIKILKEQRVCIIAGAPGIGKTTLARMIMLYFHTAKFDLVKIESNISEARDGDFTDKPKFYYYDDFLGQTSSSDKLEKNEDQKLLDFMQSVNESQNSVFVLTTREYILNQSKARYEKINRASFDHNLCVIDLDKYSRKIRAEILFNHLHFSSLHKSFIKKLIKDKTYIKIVDHENYNPRIIEILTTPKHCHGKQADEYSDFFLESLDNPENIWDDAFQNQLSDEAKHLLLTLVTLPLKVTTDNLKEAFESLHKEICLLYSIPNNPQAFKRAIKETEGSFINMEELNTGSYIEFYNPSVRDYMKAYIIKHEDYIPHLIKNAFFFEQTQRLTAFLLENNDPKKTTLLDNFSKEIHDTLLDRIDSPVCSRIIKYSGHNNYTVSNRATSKTNKFVTIAQLLDRKSANASEDALVNHCHDLLSQLQNKPVTSLDFVQNILKLSNTNFSLNPAFLALTLKIKETLMIAPSFDDLNCLQMLYENDCGGFSVADLKDIQDLMKEDLELHTEEITLNFDDPEEMREAKYILESLGKTFNIDVDSEVQEIEQQAQEKEEEHQYENWDGGYIKDTSTLEKFSTDQIQQMFSKL